MSTVASHTSISKPPEAAACLRLLGEGVCSHLAAHALGLAYPVLDGPRVLLAISPFNFQVDFLPDHICVAPLRE